MISSKSPGSLGFPGFFDRRPPCSALGLFLGRLYSTRTALRSKYSFFLLSITGGSRQNPVLITLTQVQVRVQANQPCNPKSGSPTSGVLALITRPNALVRPVIPHSQALFSKRARPMVVPPAVRSPQLPANRSRRPELLAPEAWLLVSSSTLT